MVWYINMTKTIRLSLDETLYAEMDAAAKSLGITCSAFLRLALKQALHSHRIKQWEAQEAEAFARIPMPLDEVVEWQEIQVWDDEV